METAPQSWAQLVSAARSATTHARIIAATLAVPEDNLPHRAAAYARLRDAGAFADLDLLTLTASQTAELAAVVSGGTPGVSAQRIDGVIRPHLVRLGLITAAPASRHPASDWRAMIRATPAGEAVVLAARGRPVTLTPEEAVPLAVIERGMSTRPERGVSGWPGSNLTLRVAQTWALVEFARCEAPPSEHWSGQLPPFVYRLTAAGVEALERHRSRDAAAAITSRTADALARVERAPGGDMGNLGIRDTSTLQSCIEAGWVNQGGPVSARSARRRMHLTGPGRDALEAWRFRAATQKAAPPQPSWPVTDIEPGQWVQFTNQKTFGVKGWVKVVEVKAVPWSTEARLRGNYEIWVTDEDHPEPYLYGNRSVYRTVRFQVRSL